MDIFPTQRYLNNTINLRNLTQRIMSCYIQHSGRANKCESDVTHLSGVGDLVPEGRREGDLLTASLRRQHLAHRVRASNTAATSQS